MPISAVELIANRQSPFDVITSLRKQKISSVPGFHNFYDFSRLSAAFEIGFLRCAYKTSFIFKPASILTRGTFQKMKKIVQISTNSK